MVKPISPTDIPGAKLAVYPEKVFEVWNNLIIEWYSEGTAIILLSEARNRLLKELQAAGIEFKKAYLDIEDVYRAQGWKVKYEEPAFNEDFKAHYTFTIR